MYKRWHIVSGFLLSIMFSSMLWHESVFHVYGPIIFHCMDIAHFVHSSLWAFEFPFLTVMNYAAVNTHSCTGCCVNMCFHFSWVWNWLAYILIQCLTFQGIAVLIFKGPAPFYHPIVLANILSHSAGFLHILASLRKLAV